MALLHPSLLVRFLTLSFLMLAATGAGAAYLPLELPDTLPAWDPLAAQADSLSRLMRNTEDLEALNALNTELLAEHGDKDWAIDIVMKNLRLTLTFDQLVLVLENRRPEDLGIDHLDEAAWDLMAGIHWSYHERYTTAQKLFERVIEARPSWVVPHGYLFAQSVSQMRSLDEVQGHLVACFDNGSAFNHVLYFVLSEYDKSDEPYVAMIELMGQPARYSRYKTMLTAMNMVTAVEEAEPTHSVVKSIWEDFLAAHGPDAKIYSWRFAQAVQFSLPSRKSIALLRELDPGPPDDSFAVPLADILMNLDREKEAQALIQDRPYRSTWSLALRRQLLDSLASGPDIVADFERSMNMWPESACDSSTPAALHVLGREDLWKKHWDLLTQECPSKIIMLRLLSHSIDQAETSIALIDSVESLGLAGHRLSEFRTRSESYTGATRDLDDMLAISDATKRRDTMDRAIRRARYDGDETRAKSILAMLIDQQQEDDRELVSLHQIAIDLNDEKLADSVLTTLESFMPNDPATIMARWSHLLTFASKEEATILAQKIDMTDSSWQEPSLLVRLTSWYQYFGLTEFSDKASRRALDLAPDAYMTRYARFSVLRDLQRHDESIAMLKDLASEYPGSTRLVGELLEGPKSVISMSDVPDEFEYDPRDHFAPFEYHLDDTDAVHALMLTGADKDSTDADSVVLLSRESTVLEGLESAHIRSQLIIQVLTESGVSQNQTQVVHFQPQDGIPKIQAARVIAADGSVTETPMSDILVRAATGTGVDVSDSREMVIPLRGLESGSILEVIYDKKSRSYLAGGWSNIKSIYPGQPLKRFILEMISPPGLPIYVVEHGDIEEQPVDPDTGIRTWLGYDISLLVDEEWSVPWSESITWLGLTTYREWDDVVDSFSGLFWKSIKTNDGVKETAEKLTKGLRSKEEKLDALYRFVVEDINGIAVEVGLGRLIPSSPAEVLERQWGDCKDSSGLLISLLDAVDIEARPVLVSTAGHTTPRVDFPSTQAFNHMIVQVTGVRHDPYCDPLNGPACLSPLPADNNGRLGLHIDRDGGHDLQVIDSGEVDDHTCNITIDVTPESETSLRYDIVGYYTGEPATYMRTLESYADTSFHRSFLDQSTGYGVPGDAHLEAWSFDTDECGHMITRMSYLDTTWVAPGATEVSFQNVVESSLYWGVPTSEDRKTDVVWKSPYRSKVVLRMHGSDVWDIPNRFAEHSFKTQHHQGTIEGEQVSEGGQDIAQVTHTYRLTSRVVPVGDFDAFYKEVYGFFMYAAQLYQYRRTINEEQLKDDLAYIEDFPEDLGMRYNMSQRILGQNVGGHGPDGPRRRMLAKKVLVPLLDDPQGALYAGIICAAIEAMDGRYARADSITDSTIEMLPGQTLLLSTSLMLKIELNDLEGEIARGEQLANLTNNTSVIHGLIQALVVAGREDEIEKHLRRLERLGQPITPIELVKLKSLAYERQGNGAAIKELHEKHKAELDEDYAAVFRVSYLMELEKFTEATELYEAILADSPANSHITNNLAWCYAMAGSQLDRAEQLAEVSTILSSDPNSARNTIGVIWFQQGKWEQARDLFRELYENDDRGPSRLANGYFWGLCEGVMGNNDEATRIWNMTKELSGPNKWIRRVRDSQRLLDSGGDVKLGMFMDSKLDH